jgi:tape measure domain-containing protein
MARAPTFTSYIRSELDPATGAAYRQLEASANRTYESISRKAANANTAATRVGTGIGGGQLSAQYDQIASATRRMAAAANDNQGAQRAGAAALRDGSVAATAFNRNLNTLSTTLNVVQGPLGPLAGRIRAVGGAVQELTGLRFGIAAAGAALFAFGAAANSFQQVRGKLAPLYDTQEQVNGAFARAVGIANDARAPLSAVVDLYSKLTQAGRDYSLTQAQIDRITTTASKAVALSGGTQVAREAALYQFSQGLSSNRLGGDELRSILEGAPQLARAIADGLGQVQGFAGTTLGDLRRLGSEGKLTADVIAQALGNAAATVDARFDKLPKTLSQAGTQFSNQFTQIIGNIDNATGATNALATGLISVADNLRTVIALGAGLASAFVAPRLIGLLTDLSKAIAQTRELQALEKAGQVSIIRPIGTRAGDAQRSAGFAAAGAESATAARAAAQAEVAAIEARIAALTEERAQIQSNIGKAREQMAAAQESATARAAGVRSVSVALAGEREAMGVTIAEYQEFAAAERASSAQAVADAEARVAALRVESEQLAANLALYEKRAAASLSARQTRNNLNQQGNAFVPLGAQNQQALERQGAAQRSQMALRRESEAIAKTLAASERELAAARNVEALAAERQTVADQAASGAQAEAELVRQSTILTRYQLASRATTQALTADTAALATAQTTAAAAASAEAAALRTATVAGRACAAATSLLAGAFNLLKAAVPVLIITALVSAVTYLATAESTAAKNARELAEAQAELGSYVDLTTGKIIQQNKELLKNQQQKQDATIEGQRGAYGDARNRLLAFGQTTRRQAYAVEGGGGTVEVSTGIPPEVARLVQDVANGRRGAGRALDVALAEFSKSNADVAAQIRDAVTAYQGAAQSLSSATAGGRLLRGQGRAGDTRRAQGDFTGAVEQAKQQGDRTRTQIEDQANIDLAQSDLTRARAELKRVRDEARAAQKNGTFDAEKYAVDYRNAVSAVNAARDAQKAHTASVREASKAQREHVADLRRADQEQLQAAREQADANLRNAQQDLEERRPELSQQQYLDERIRILETYDDERNKIEDGGRASHAADDQRIKDARGLAGAQANVTREFANQQQVNGLLLQGREAEATALRQVLELQNQYGDAALAMYPQLLANARSEERTNSLLESRQRILSVLRSSADDTREAFEQFLLDLPERGAGAAGDLLRNLERNYASIGIRQLSERLFAGADDKVRALIEGRSKTDQTISTFNTSLGRGSNAALDFADAVQRAIARVNAAGSTTDANGDIVVTAPRAASTATSAGASVPELNTPNAKSIYNVIGATVGANFDKALQGLGIGRGKPLTQTGQDTELLFGSGASSKSGFFSKLGGTLGTALGGAATGSSVNSLLSPIGKALGVKTSRTGAQVGGAIGGLTGIPGGDIIGSVIGSVVGGLFKKTKYSTASLSVDSFGNISSNVTGNSNKAEKAAGAAADSVGGALSQIASSLGARITGTPNITLGTYKGEYRVSTTGYTGKLKNGKPGVVDFDDDQQAAIEFAIRTAISKSVITGISQASVNILKSGQDLQQAIQKASVIESIPKQLLALTDPVASAVQTLNDTFTNTISILKEGSATAQQFADAEKLYNLQREEAIKQAAQASYGQIDDLLKSLTQSSSSPLNRSTVYANAGAALDPLAAQVRAGKVVDQDALVTAVQNRLDASRNLNGSGIGYFNDFNSIIDLLKQARTNAIGGSGGTNLPGSPFDTSGVTTAISTTGTSTVAAINNQTTTLADRINTLSEAVLTLAQGTPNGGSSAIRLLKGANLP